MALQASDLADLVALTRKQEGRMKWTNISYSLQEHIAMPQILRKERVGFQSGTAIQFNVMVNNSGAARNVGLFEVDSVNIADTMTKGEVPWRHSNTNYAIERREIAMNRNPSRIVELIKTRRLDAMQSLADLMENDFWGKPATSADTLTPFGIDYWIVKNATEGFNGGDPAGFSGGAAGLATATYANWKNYTAQYAAITSTDLLRKWRKAAVFTKFMPPVANPDYNTGDRYGYYTNYAVLGTLEEVLEAQNDNLGNDIASKDGRVTFRRVPVTWVPKLEADAQNPVYGINWGVFKPIFLTGEYLVEEGPVKAANMHTTLKVEVDLTYNYECRDRRRNFILNIAA